MAPPSMSLFLISRRRDRKASYPSIALSCVAVMGFPCRFRSIRSVSVQSSSGRGCGWSPAERRLRRSERTLSFVSFPTAAGSPTITLSSRFSSVRPIRSAMVSGTVARLFDERSSFSSILRLLSTMLRGTPDREFLASRIVLSPLGRFAGRAGRDDDDEEEAPEEEAGRPSWLSLADSVFSLDSDDRTAKLPGDSLFRSTLSDLRTLRLASFGSSVFSLFPDRSSVVSLEISKTGSGQDSSL
mmetsp:Transcript_21939/g.52211  ORF Transcript_21939/g.52211 Transcript_21939/m.52211 type:complete len:242 (+) Transcript_21939:263-988(+)